MPEIGDAWVDIDARTKKFDAKMMGAKGAVKDFAATGAQRMTALGTRTGEASLAMTRAVARIRVAIGLLKFAFVGLVVGTGIRSVVKAFIEQDAAVRKLAASIANTGGSVKATLSSYEAFASSIQKVTTHGDELILAQMAIGLNLGINESQLKDATKAAIGLSAAYDIDLKTAMMLVGRASQGQTQMLTRYGIAVDKSATKTEQFNQFLRDGADKFNLATDAANSLAGRTEQMGNAFGDAKEAIGSVIADLFDLKGVAEGAAAAFADFASSLSMKRAEGGFIIFSEVVKATMKDIVLRFRTAFDFMVEIASLAIEKIVNKWLAMSRNLGRALFTIVHDVPFERIAEEASQTFDELFADLDKDFKASQARIKAMMQSRIEERLRDLKNEIGGAGEGAKAVEDAEKRKRKAMSQSSDFADIVRKAQEAAFDDATPGAGGRGGGGAGGAGAGGGGGGGGSKQAIFVQMLTELKLITQGVKAMAVMG